MCPDMKKSSASKATRKITPAEIFEDLFPTQPQTGFYFEAVNEYEPFKGWNDDIFFTLLPNPDSALDQIASYDEAELTQLARVIALTHRQYFVCATRLEKKQHVQLAHAFGVKVRVTKHSTLDGLVSRLSDPRWWRRQINRLADARREHLAQIKRQLGRRADQQCCSDATMAIMRARKIKTDKFLGGAYKVISQTIELESPVVFSLLEVAQAQQANRINELYVDIKAMEKIAIEKGWGWMFITLTAPAEYHSNPALGRDSYDPNLSPRDANKSIGRDWIAICGALKEQGLKPRETYFGFRVTEVHEDGCPHWHILVFHAPGVERVVEKAIGRIYSNRPSSYFERNKANIIRFGLPKENVSAASAASYIYGYLAFALSGGEDPNGSGTAYQYQCAIKAMGARQYQMFGINGARGKLRALAKVKRLRDCPDNILKLARRLHVDQGVDGRNEIQLNARVEFLLGGASRLELIKEVGLNSLGESVEKTVGIKHQDDMRSVIISGLCEDIDADVVKNHRR